ncbi:634_t:CDS:2 [Ambispora gerdemannii]|uniref:634_t:CDS:1 n=1 Tax=Ambispora gerdemannii TaxID=144530 RepID=A0A9N8ZKH7_9GLOM|nr:634_t:CDS:2 [Ambispora gerdemannii]
MNDLYWIVSDTGHVLDVTGSNTAPGTPVILYTINNLSNPLNQLWRIDGNHIVSKLNGFALSLSDCVINVIQPKNDEDKRQHWRYDVNDSTLNSVLPYYVATVVKPVIADPKALGCKHLDTPVAPKAQRFVFVKWSGYKI